jgi:hypothetical protein
MAQVVTNRSKHRRFRQALIVFVPSMLVASFAVADRVSFAPSSERPTRPVERVPSKVATTSGAEVDAEVDAEVEVAGVTLKRTVRATFPVEATSPDRRVPKLQFDRTGRPLAAVLGPDIPPTTKDQGESLGGRFPGDASQETTTTSETTTSQPRAKFGPPTSRAFRVSESWRLIADRTYADDALVVRPLSFDTKPTRTLKQIRRVATRLATKRFKDLTDSLTADIWFAEFDAPIGEWIGSNDSGGVEARPVWIAHYSKIVQARTPLVQGRESEGATSQDVVTDFLVIIDDETGAVLIASEYLSK